MFEAIWNDRPHVSEISGQRLIENPNDFHFYWQFAHVLGKQAYPRYKLNPENIMLMTWKEHEKQENFDIYQKRRQELIEKYYRDE